MLFKNDISNCRIILYTLEGHEQIADTYIKRFDSNRDIGVIDAYNFEKIGSQKVTALVFDRTGLIECNGTLRDGFGLEKEICFFKTNVKNDRGATRYDVNMMGNIVAVLKKDSGSIEKDIFQCHVENMSATGVLIRTPSERLKIGDVPSITCYKDGHKMQIVAEIVRIHTTSVQEDKFGCRIVKLVSS